ncbi:MAG TPA: histidinol-phosphate transaminase [Pyrinomonadaceae bacterium]
MYSQRNVVRHDGVIDTLPIYTVSESATLGYRDKDTWMKLDWNESPRKASDKVAAAIKRFLDEHSLAYYPDVTSRELVLAISERFKVSNSAISIFNGSDSALQHIFYTFLSGASTFTTCQPTYTQILQFVSFKRPDIRFYFPSDVFNIDWGEFERSYISGSDVVYIVNPHNPTGELLSKDYLLFLAKTNPSTLFVIDEAYMEFSSIDESCIPFVESQRNLIVTRTFSKAYGLAGIRLGFAISHEDNIALIHRMKNNKDVNTLAQIAGEAAILDTDYLQNHVREIRRIKEWFVKNVPVKFPVIDTEANFVLLNYEFESGLIDRLKSDRILVRDRSDQHGLRNFLRVTIGTDKQMRAVVEALERSE